MIPKEPNDVMHPQMNNCYWCNSQTKVRKSSCSSEFTRFWVVCLNDRCNASGPTKEEPEDSVKSWNKLGAASQSVEEEKPVSYWMNKYDSLKKNYDFEVIRGVRLVLDAKTLRNQVETATNALLSARTTLQTLNELQTWEDCTTTIYEIENALTALSGSKEEVKSAMVCLYCNDNPCLCAQKECKPMKPSEGKDNEWRDPVDWHSMYTKAVERHSKLSNICDQLTSERDLAIKERDTFQERVRNDHKEQLRLMEKLSEAKVVLMNWYQLWDKDFIGWDNGHPDIPQAIAFADHLDQTGNVLGLPKTPKTTPPPSPSVEPRGEPSAEEALNWFCKAMSYDGYYIDGQEDDWKVSDNIESEFYGKTPIEAIRNAMKKESE